MRRSISIFVLSLITLMFFACNDSSVSPEPEKIVNSVEESSFSTASGPITDPDLLATLAEVREATAEYHDVSVAEDSGYQQVSPFVPGMGYHYLNGSLMDAEVIPTQPEALVYVDNPVDDSMRRLVAVEYIIPEDLVNSQSDLDGMFPGVDGDTWHHEDEIDAWTLHAWVWYDNPEGVFHPTNPRVNP